METVTEQSVWTTYLTARQARNVARELKKAGYGTATIANCREYVINLATRLEPGDPAARRKVLRIICEAAGIQPRSS
jgi:hypothetical protein